MVWKLGCIKAYGYRIQVQTTDRTHHEFVSEQTFMWPNDFPGAGWITIFYRVFKIQQDT